MGTDPPLNKARLNHDHPGTLPKSRVFHVYKLLSDISKSRYSSQKDWSNQITPYTLSAKSILPKNKIKHANSRPILAPHHGTAGLACTTP
jgi:hypothetical protein